MYVLADHSKARGHRYGGSSVESDDVSVGGVSIVVPVFVRFTIGRGRMQIGHLYKSCGKL